MAAALPQLDEEAATCTLLKSSETKWREEFVSEMWLIANEEVAHRRIINCVTLRL
jgi:hypothetical protein